MSKNQNVIAFNKQLFDFLKQSNILCDRMKSTCIQQTDIIKMENLVNVKEDSLISLFITYGLKYKPIFETYDYNAVGKFDIKSIDLATVNVTAIAKYLEFKKLWDRLNADNKKKIFDYMKSLCNISQNYLIAV